MHDLETASVRLPIVTDVVVYMLVVSQQSDQDLYTSKADTDGRLHSLDTKSNTQKGQ